MMNLHMTVRDIHDTLTECRIKQNDVLLITCYHLLLPHSLDANVKVMRTRYGYIIKLLSGGMHEKSIIIYHTIVHETSIYEHLTYTRSIYGMHVQYSRVVEYQTEVSRR